MTDVGKISIRVTPNLAGFREEVRAAATAAGREHADINVGADTAAANAKINEVARDRDSTVHVKTDTSQAKQAADAFQRRLTKSLDRSMSGLESKIGLDKSGELFRRQMSKLADGLKTDIKSPIPEDLGEAADRRKELEGRLSALRQIAGLQKEDREGSRKFDVVDKAWDARQKQRITGIREEAAAAEKAAADRDKQDWKHAQISRQLHDFALKYRNEQAAADQKAHDDRLRQFADELKTMKAQHREKQAFAKKLRDDPGLLSMDPERVRRERAMLSVRLPKKIGKQKDSFAPDVSSLIPSLGTGVNIPAMILLASMAPPLLALVSGAMMTLPGLLMGVIAPMGAVALGFQGIGNAMENAGLVGRDKKGKLKVGPELQGLMDTVGKTFEDKLTPVFKSVVDTMFPVLKTAVPKLAGGLADMFGGFANQLMSEKGLGQINNIFSNLGEAARRAVPGVGALTDAMMTLADKLIAKFPGMSDRFNGWMQEFQGWVTKITTPDASGVSQFDTAMSNLRATLSEIVGLAGDLFKFGWDELGKKDFGEGMKSFVSSIRELVTSTLPSLAESFKNISSSLSDITNTIKPIIDNVNTIKGVTDYLPSNIAKRWAGSGWKRLGQAFNGGSFFENPIEGKPTAAKGEDDGKEYAGGVKKGAEGAFTGGINIPGGFLKPAFESDTDAKKHLGPGIDPAVPAQVQEITAQQEAAAAELKRQVDASVAAVTEGLAQSGKPIQETVANVWDKFLENATTVLTSIGQSMQTSWTMMSVGANKVWDSFKLGADTAISGIVTQASTLWTGLQTTATTVLTAIQTSITNIGTSVSGSWSKLSTEGSTAFNGLRTAADAALAAVKTSFVNAGNAITAEVTSWKGKITGAFNGLTGEMSTIGTNAGAALMKGVADGITANAETAKNSAKTAMEGIRALFPNSPAKEGPFSGKGWVSYSGMSIGQAFGQGIEQGFSGVADRARSILEEINNAINSGVQVSPQTKQQLKQVMAELGLQYDQLKVDKNNATSKEEKAAIAEKMKQIQALRDQLRLQKDQIGYADKYGDQQFDIGQQMQDALSKSIDVGKNAAMSNANQFMSDMGLPGGGALTTVADTGLSWATGMLQKAITGGLGGGGNTTIQVNSIDEALAAKQTLVNKQALQFQPRT